MDQTFTPGMPVSVVTGANRGIGRWIALGLAQAGHHVVMLVRDQGRGEAAQAWIAQRHPAASTELAVVDLSVLADVRTVGSAIAAAHPRLTVVVNNAGLITPHRMLTTEGREKVLAVNHLAPFVLAAALEPALIAGAPSRLINVGSTASDRATIDFDDLELTRGWRIWRAYGRSKLALMMASFERSRRLTGTGVAVHVVHPGLVGTDIGLVPGPAGWGWSLVKLFSITEQQGAVTPLHAALSAEAGRRSGVYWKKSAPATANQQARNRAACARLWAMTEQLAGASTGG